MSCGQGARQGGRPKLRRGGGLPGAWGSSTLPREASLIMPFAGHVAHVARSCRDARRLPISALQVLRTFMNFRLWVQSRPGRVRRHVRSWRKPALHSRRIRGSTD